MFSLVKAGKVEQQKTMEGEQRTLEIRVQGPRDPIPSLSPYHETHELAEFILIQFVFLQ